MTRTTTVTIDDVDLDIDFTYYPGEPARLSGHPDNWCEGDDPYYDIEDVRICGQLISIASLLDEDVFEKIENELEDIRGCGYE